MYYEWLDSELSYAVSSRFEKYARLLDPNNCTKPLPHPFHLKIANAPDEPGAYLDHLAIGAPYPKVVSLKAREGLGDFLAPAGTFFDCVLKDSPVVYCAWIPMLFIDALDEDRSVITRTAFVTTVKRAVLRASEVEGLHVFCLAGHKFAGVFVSQKFVDRVSELGLTGFEFVPVESV